MTAQKRHVSSILKKIILLFLFLVCLDGFARPVLHAENTVRIPQVTESQVLPSLSAGSVSPDAEIRSVAQSKIAGRLNGNLSVLPILHGTALLRGVAELKSFYSRRNWQPAWFDGEQETAAVAAFLAVLGKAEEEGLSSRDYHYEDIKMLQGSLDALSSTDKADTQADLDILLTDAYRAYAAHLYSGMIEPGRVSDQWPVQKNDDPNTIGILEVPPADQMAKKLESLPPAYLGYRQLRELLAKYRRIEAHGGWPFIPGGKLMPGQRHPRVALLKKRLFLTGELSAVPGKNVDLYDGILGTAVRQFQRTHNLKEDGVAGGETLRFMNIPVGKRIDQIRLNMERWRWMPRNMDRYIFVNIPSFELIVAENGFVVLKMRTIVGMEDNPTPSFADRLTQIEINPLWNIPRSIIEKEIIPKVKRDPAYLTRQGIRIYRDWRPDAPEIAPAEIDWVQMTPKKFPYRLVQDPGPQNPLGQIKFLFPNNFNVYMHDTPSRYLFGRQGRTFSHGCIRLEKPIDLAVYLLKKEPGWGRKQILQKIGSGQRHVISLRESIPVHIVYLTVWKGADGLTYFRDDLYEYDHLLDTAMRKNGGKTGGFLF